MARDFFIVLKTEANLTRFADERGAAIRRGAMRGATRFAARAKLEFRRPTRSALGDRAANTWRADVYPKGRAQSWHPAVNVYSKWPRVIEAFYLGATIRPKNAVVLAIPSENVPKIGGRRMTPKEVEARFGQELIIFPARGGGSYAFIDKGLRRRQLRHQSRGSRGAAPVANPRRLTLMFTFRRQVTLRPRLDLDRIDAALAPVFNAYLAEDIARETAK